MSNLIIDGDNLLHRVHWMSQKNGLVNSKGEDAGTIFLFLRAIKSYAEHFKSTKIIVVWDKQLTHPSTNFRKEILKQSFITYKGTRNDVASSMVHSTEDLIVEALTLLGIQQVHPNVLEADDVISWLTFALEGEITIVSADNDLYQLVREPRIQIYHPFTKATITTSNFVEKIGIDQSLFVTYKAIKGDKSDNIPGLRGYGEVKAKTLAAEFHNNPNLTQEQIDLVLRNIKVMDLSIGFQMHEGETEIYKQQLAKAAVADFVLFSKFCEEHEFKSILDDFSNWVNTFNGYYPPEIQTTLKKKG